MFEAKAGFAGVVAFTDHIPELRIGISVEAGQYYCCVKRASVGPSRLKPTVRQDRRGLSGRSTFPDRGDLLDNTSDKEKKFRATTFGEIVQYSLSEFAFPP